MFGGPNETPANSSRFQWVQGAVLASMIASGPVRRRYGSHPPAEADERWFILCNLAVRRTVMRRFDDALVCAEENALLGRAARRRANECCTTRRCGCFTSAGPTCAASSARCTSTGGAEASWSAGPRRRMRLAFLAPSVLVLYLVA